MPGSWFGTDKYWWIWESYLSLDLLLVRWYDAENFSFKMCGICSNYCVFSVEIRGICSNYGAFNVKIGGICSSYCVFSVKVRGMCSIYYVFSVKIGGICSNCCVFNVKIRVICITCCVFDIKLGGMCSAVFSQDNWFYVFTIIFKDWPLWWSACHWDWGSTGTQIAISSK